MATISHPVIPLPYGTVLFPGKSLDISPAGREDVIAVIAKYYSGALKTRAKDSSPLVACVPLRSPFLSPEGKKLIEDGNPKREVKRRVPDVNSATADDLFKYGCMAKIAGVRGGRRGEVALMVEGVGRCEVEKFTNDKPFFEAHVKELKDFVDVWDPAVKGHFAHLKELSKELFQIVRMSSIIHRDSGFSPILLRQLETFVARKDVSDAGFLADFMAVLGQCTFEDKLWLLSAANVASRLQRANELVSSQIKALQGNTKILIVNNSQENMDPDKLKQMQKNQQIRNKNGAPPASFKMPPGVPGGNSNEDEDEVQELAKRLEEAGLSDEASKAAQRELKRLAKMNPVQAEYGVIRNYLEVLAEIPWSKVTEDNLNAATLARARKQLDDDHYGLETIKKRLLEYLAVLKLKQTANNALEAQIKAITDKETAAREAAAKQKQEKEAKKDAKDKRSAASSPEGEKDKNAQAPQPLPPAPESAELKHLRAQKRVDKSPILLLVGPPGTGKTSLAKSVATALGRKFHRISLGGVRDEAEIRGHRRTYVAAMPGLIVSGLKKVGVANPVFLLDEIDKVGTNSYHGDPSAAMLEVLDPEQNHTFMDHYVNIPIDLSKVLFIATANSLDTIPPPLLDRMETIQLSGYTTIEKRHIAMQHLLPKQVRSNGMHKGDIDLSEEVIDKIITAYTRESGVRNLEREIGSVCRYKAVQYAESQDPTASADDKLTTTVHKTASGQTAYNPAVAVDELEEILGIERFTDELASKDPPRPGVVTGLVAFAQLGQGSILFIEVADMPGKGRVQLTGKLGDVLKESVEVALTWVKSHAYELSIAGSPDEDIMARRSIHVHCPAGAIPKDGPSAGLAHTIALISLFKGLPVPPTLAMTGEVSLRGKVTPVGGIKEKLIGAHRAGVKTVLLPKENRKEVKDVPEEVKRELDICFVGGIWEALRLVWPEERWEGGWVESRL